MPDIDKMIANADEIAKEVNARKGAIKVDSNELARHPRIVARLGEYAEVCPLKSGDFAFDTAWGKKARIEYKLWDNLIADVGSKHLNDQLRKQLEDDNLSILLIEGVATATTSGKIKTFHREYPEPWWWLWNYLTSAQLAGTYIYLSPNELQTPNIIRALFEYCQKSEHKVMSERQKLNSMHPALSPHQRSFTSIPGVGDDIAKVIDEKYHSSLVEFGDASVEEIQNLQYPETDNGNIATIGRVRAMRIWNYLHGKA